MDISSIITQVKLPEDADSPDSEECSDGNITENNNNKNLPKGSSNGVVQEVGQASAPATCELNTNPYKTSADGDIPKTTVINIEDEVEDGTLKQNEKAVSTSGESTGKQRVSLFRSLFWCCGMGGPNSRKHSGKTKRKSSVGEPSTEAGVSPTGDGGGPGLPMVDIPEVDATMEMGGIHYDGDIGELGDSVAASSDGSDLEDHQEEIPLLGDLHTQDLGKKCLIIDLDETLVHSSFKPVENADFIVAVEIEGFTHQVYVLKRPHVNEFLQKMGQLFECVLFTASLGKYADPVVDLLDQWDVFRHRLFREACVFHRGNFVKNLDQLGRDVNQIVILDNSPVSYLFHPQNAIQITSWFDDPSDTALLDLMPYMEGVAKSESAVAYLQSHAPPSPSCQVIQFALVNMYSDE